MTDPMTDSPASARQRLELAKAELSRAQAEIDQERRAGWLAELMRVREELRQARSRHAELVGQIHPARKALQEQQQRIQAAMERIADSEKARPEAADYLPEDPEVRLWKREHDRLRHQCGNLIEQRDRMPDPNDITAQANVFEGPGGTIVQLVLAEANLLRQLQGTSPIVRLEGGVYGVR